MIPPAREHAIARGVVFLPDGRYTVPGRSDLEAAARFAAENGLEDGREFWQEIADGVFQKLIVSKFSYPLPRRRENLDDDVSFDTNTRVVETQEFAVLPATPANTKAIVSRKPHFTPEPQPSELKEARVKGVRRAAVRVNSDHGISVDLEMTCTCRVVQEITFADGTAELTDPEIRVIKFIQTVIPFACAAERAAELKEGDTVLLSLSKNGQVYASFADGEPLAKFICNPIWF